MREIKFRAWDTKDKIMKFFDFYNIHCGVYFPCHWRDSTGLACELDDKGRYPNELMQYTGLKDKNGKEIYEGDMFWYKWWEQPTILRIVEFYHGSFIGRDTNHVIPMEAIGQFLTTRTEIIGNIYENPDLQKEERC